ncbi:hypothetical protein [Nannocystis punicea]|uniref:Uncharacterized protein n=1 Tax=Nannocystis punicea TaxID=2995304 RepID=A0ABY7GRK9_9BACT|nr:hypothetical protein [Nannocystis poenicansa]WAS89594.1 hypothetical protein O0S08_25650 [Nannocystis poenicansa]
MKKSRSCVPAIVTALTLAAPAVARAGDCKSDTQIAAELWQKFGEEIKRFAAEVGAQLGNLSAEEIKKKLDDVETAVRRAEAKANETFKNGKWKIGPRALPAGETLDGDLKAERVFLTQGPSLVDNVKIVLDGEGGDAKSDVTVTICTIDASGKYEKVHDFTFGKADYQRVFERTVAAAAGKVVSVHLERKTYGLNNYKYKLRMDRPGL